MAASKYGSPLAVVIQLKRSTHDLAGMDPGFSERGSDKRPLALSNKLLLIFNESFFFTRKSMVKIFVFVSL